jgi:hypothetical protein
MWLERLKHFFRKPTFDKPSSADSQWCLIGNIGKSGTKHFAPGTKVYCFPPQWGDGYEKVVVIGRHRGSRRFVTMIVDSSGITNWRAKVIYSPEVLRRLRETAFASGEVKARAWSSKNEIDEMITSRQ